MRSNVSDLLDDKRVWVTCHSDPVGAAIVHRLWRERCEIVLAGASQLDLMRQAEVETWFHEQRPEVVFLTDPPPPGPTDAEAPASVLHRRLTMHANILAAARASGVAKLVNLTIGRMVVPSPRPGVIPDRAAAEAFANLISIALTRSYSREHGCRFVVLLSSCVCGPNSLADRNPPDALSMLFARVTDAARRGDAEIEVTGRDLLPYGLIHADDLADAAVYVATHYEGDDPVHCGVADGASPRAIAALLADLADYHGKIVTKARMDDRRRRQVAAIDIGSLGWRPEMPFQERLREMHELWRRPSAAG